MAELITLFPHRQAAHIIDQSGGQYFPVPAPTSLAVQQQDEDGGANFPIPAPTGSVYMMNVATQQVIRVDQSGNVTELSQADMAALQTQFDKVDQTDMDTMSLHRRGGIGGGVHLGPIGGGAHLGRGGIGGGAHIGPIGGGIHIGRGGFWGGGRWHHHHWHHRHGRWAGDWAVIYA